MAFYINGAFSPLCVSSFALMECCTVLRSTCWYFGVIVQDQSFNKLISGHKKGGGVRGWGNGWIGESQQV